MLHRYSNIFVTSPSPENLKTLFEFVFKGFDALEYQVRIFMKMKYCQTVLVGMRICKGRKKYNYHFSILLQEHLDYELVQSTNPEFNKAIVRVNIFRDHRQTIQVRVNYRVHTKVTAV